MLGWRRKKQVETVGQAAVGLALNGNDCAVVLTNQDEAGHPRVVAWEVIPFETPGDLQKDLGAFVDRHGIAGLTCRAVLPTEDYGLRLVERPANIPDDDLVEATRWLIRDLIDFDVESAELALLPIPEHPNRARTPHMFVVASRSEPSLDLAHAIDGAGLRLLGFEIVESTMLALEGSLPDIAAGSAMLRLDHKSSAFTVARDGHLGLARPLHVDLESLDQIAGRALSMPDPCDRSLIDELDPLILEAQRSLDYYESEYGQAAVSRLTLLPAAMDVTPLVPALSEALRPVRVEAFDLTHAFVFPEPPPSDLLEILTLAAGVTHVTTEAIGPRLLPASFRPSEGGFNLGSVVRITATIAFLLAAYYGLTLFQIHRRDGQLAAIEAQLDKLATEIESLREADLAAASGADPETELLALMRERDARIAMFRDMTQRSSRRDASFSTLLTGLARQDPASIWLERIEFSHGGDAITLEGRTLSPDAIPDYLRHLGIEPGFKARRFRTFALKQQADSTGGHAFRLATLEDEPDEETSE